MAALGKNLSFDSDFKFSWGCFCKLFELKREPNLLPRLHSSRIITMAKKSKSGKKGRRGWTTEEQIEYLESLKVSYLAAQSTKKTSDFWPPVEEEWFTRWPSELTTEDIKNGKTIADVQDETKMVRIMCL